MRELSNVEAFSIKGGFSITGTLLNGLYRSINSLLSVGRSFGTSLRMIKSGKICPL